MMYPKNEKMIWLNYDNEYEGKRVENDACTYLSWTMWFDVKMLAQVLIFAQV